MSSTKLETLENSIKAQCEEFENILDLLRNHYFDEQKYRRLYNTLERYNEALKGEKCLDRNIAGYLETFRLYLYSATQHHSKLGKKSPYLSSLENAWNEVIELTGEIYFGE